MIWLILLLAQNLSDAEAVSRGEKIFAQNCSVGYCHGVAGAAGRGPRLRGRKLDKAYVEQVTRDGLSNSAMPGWKERLSQTDIEAVVAYVMILSTASDQAPPPNPMPPGAGPAALPEFAGPPQARRGHDLFFDATRTPRCSTCHFAGGRGIPVGPDLTSLASQNDSELTSLIHSTGAKHVITAKLKNGEVFPALRVEQDDTWIKLYDLGTSFPVLRTLARAEIASLVAGSDWGHQAAARNYSSQEVQEILTYLRWLNSSANQQPAQK